MTGPELAHLVASAAIAFPLLYAGVAKFLEPTTFSNALARYGVPLLAPSDRAARTIGSAEVAAGAVCVLVPAAASALAVGVLYFGFAVILARAIERGETGNCGCFGAFETRIGAIAVVRNLALGAGSLGIGAARLTVELRPYESSAALAVVISCIIVGATLDTVLGIRGRPRS